MIEQGLRVFVSTLPEQGGVISIEVGGVVASHLVDKPVVTLADISRFHELTVVDLAGVSILGLLPSDFELRDQLLWKAWQALRVGGVVYVVTPPKSLGGGSVDSSDGGLLAMKTVPGYERYRSWVTESSFGERIGHLLLKKVDYEE